MGTTVVTPADQTHIVQKGEDGEGENTTGKLTRYVLVCIEEYLIA